jgi:hypothetical protein
MDGSITGNATERWYSFTVNAGTTYYVWWNDSYNGDYTKTLDIKVSAFHGNGNMIFGDEDSGWNSPVYFTADLSGTVYLRVNPYDPNAAGTFAITYGTSSTRP